MQEQNTSLLVRAYCSEIRARFSTFRTTDGLWTMKACGVRVLGEFGGFWVGFGVWSGEVVGFAKPRFKQNWGVYRCPSLSEVEGTKTAAQG